MTSHPITIESAGGEYMESVVVLAWSVKIGDPVKAGDLLVTVETAKAATEIEADRDGWLAAIHYDEGQEAPVGATLGEVADTMLEAGALTTIPLQTEAGLHPASADKLLSTAKQTPLRSNNTRIIASPLARRLAQNAGLDLSEITGSGPNGRIKQRDIQAALETSPPTRQVVSRPAISADLIAAPVTLAGSYSLPIVLLHGFGADSSAWRQVIALLKADMRTVAIDLPGHGSNAGILARSVEDLADFVSEKLEEQGIQQAHFVGHSLGGSTALALTSIGRIAVRSLTLLAPAGLGPDISGAFIAGLTSSVTEPALERWLTFMLAATGTLPKGYAGAVLRQMEKIGNRSALQTLAGYLFSGDTQIFDGHPALDRLDIPTRIVWGQADRVIPASHARRAPGFAAVHLLPGVGHVPQMEAPAMTARLIMETVNSASA